MTKTMKTLKFTPMKHYYYNFDSIDWMIDYRFYCIKLNKND